MQARRAFFLRKLTAVLFIGQESWYPVSRTNENTGGHTMYQIRYVYNHYQVYSPAGRFLFSADTESEAWEELAALEN